MSRQTERKTARRSLTRTTEPFVAHAAAIEADHIAQMADYWLISNAARNNESRQSAARWLLQFMAESFWRIGVASEIDQLGDQLCNPLTLQESATLRKPVHGE